MSEELLAIINVFVVSNNGRCAAENRRRKLEECKKTKRCKKDEEKGKIVEENENSNYNLKKVVELRRNIHNQCVLSR